MKSKLWRGCLFSVFFLSFICLFVVILGQCPDASSKIRRSSTEHIHNPAADVQIHHHAAQIRQPITHTHARHPESGGGSPNVAQRIPQCVVWSIKLCSAPRLMPSVDQIRTVSYLGPICRLPACGQRRADSGRAAGVGGGRRARGRAGGRTARQIEWLWKIEIRTIEGRKWYIPDCKRVQVALMARSCSSDPKTRMPQSSGRHVDASKLFTCVFRSVPFLLYVFVLVS